MIDDRFIRNCHLRPARNNASKIGSCVKQCELGHFEILQTKDVLVLSSIRAVFHDSMRNMIEKRADRE